MNGYKKRSLDITIRYNNENIEVDVYEPESGEVTQLQAPFSPDEHPEFDKAIGNEIYSWISLWLDNDSEEE